MTDSPSQFAPSQHAGKLRSARWSLALRLLTAIVGGYALATTGGLLFAAALPVNRVDGVMLGLLLSFALYCVAVMWVFAVHSLRRACLGVWAFALAAGLLAWGVNAGAGL